MTCPKVAIAVGFLLIAHAARAVEFAACVHGSGEALMVTATGDVYRASGTENAVRDFSFSRAPGTPFRWQERIQSATKWKSAWLVADGSNRIFRFRANGHFESAFEVPFRVARLASAGERLWALNMLAMTSTEQLWYSLDGRTFSPHKDTTRRAFGNPLENLLVLGGGSRGDLYVAPIVGTPEARRVWPEDKAATFSLAYSRTKHRASLERIIGLIGDVAPYSQPVRDLLVTDDGELLVLRNREDVIDPEGKRTTIQARRVDRYDSSGRHVATAVLSESARCISRVSHSHAVVLNGVGKVIRAPWGKALPSEMLTP